MASSEAQEKRQELEKEERQLITDFQERKENLTRQLAPLNDQITHLKNETFLMPFRQMLTPSELDHGSFSKIFPMLRSEKDNLPLYLGAVEQALDDPKLERRGRGGLS
jgi:hypothetical protein